MLKVSLVALVCFTTIVNCFLPSISTRELNKLRTLKDRFLLAEEATGIDAALLAAVASRESNTGLTLDKNGYGYKEEEYGIMQIHRRYHRIDQSGGPDSLLHIIQGATILRDMIAGVTEKHPSWPRFYQIKGGIAAYNFGVRNVQTINGIDRGTTHNNYSSDVLNRKMYLEDKVFQSIAVFNSVRPNGTSGSHCPSQTRVSHSNKFCFLL